MLIIRAVLTVCSDKLYHVIILKSRNFATDSIACRVTCELDIKVEKGINNDF